MMTGRGSVVMRGRVHIEPMGKDREAIIVTEIPYQVNKAKLLERIADGYVNRLKTEIPELIDSEIRNAGGISVTSYNRKVLLTGQVLDEKALLLDDRYDESPDTSGWQPQRAIGVIVVDGAIDGVGGLLLAPFTLP